VNGLEAEINCAGGSGMGLWVIAIILGVIAWNLKTGIERIEKKLGDIFDALKEKE